MTILQSILTNYLSIQGIGLIWLRIGILESPCKCGIEPPCSISHRVNWLSILSCYHNGKTAEATRYWAKKPSIKIVRQFVAKRRNKNYSLKHFPFLGHPLRFFRSIWLQLFPTREKADRLQMIHYKNHPGRNEVLLLHEKS
jgi:hypothetical protein